VGYLNGVTIKNCFSTASVIGKTSVGGVAGYYWDYEAQNCLALNSLVSGDSDVGRVFGFYDNGEFTNIYAFEGITVTVNGSVKTIFDDIRIDGQSKTADNIKAADFFETLFDSDDAWQYAEGKLPILKDLDGQDGTLPSHISGTYFEGSGIVNEEVNDPYLIKTAADLARLAELVTSNNADVRNAYNNKYYRLENDIDLSDYQSDEGWTPIGENDTKPFKGIFDGNNKVITGLKINSSANSQGLGLFGYIDNGTVMNLGMINVNIQGGPFVGGLAGQVWDGTVRNCYITGSVRGTRSDTDPNFMVGGLVGVITTGSNTSNVENCYSACSVSATIPDSDYPPVLRVGGLAGLVSGTTTIKNCYSTGSVSVTDNDGSVKRHVGGLVGYLSASLQNCYSTASVSVTSSRNTSSGCYVGGIVGYSASEVKNCAALNSSVTATDTADIYVGRVAGGFADSSLSNNYAFNNILPDSWSNKGLNDKDGDDVTQEILADGDFWTTEGNWDGSSWDSNVWTFADNKLPILQGLAGQNDIIPSHISGSYYEGSGIVNEEINDPYLIKTAADLMKLANLVNAGTSPYADLDVFYRLENNIDLSAYGKDYNSGQGWMPIGRYLENKPFRGVNDKINLTVFGQ
jgi:fibronectin-binding autotransporter adhesin